MSDALLGLTMPPLHILLPILLGLLAVAVLYAAIWRKRATSGPEFPLAAEALIPTAAEKAVARARARFNVNLDYSIASIHEVETMFAKLSDARATSPDLIDVNSLSFVFGAYIGETIRLNHAGFLWQRDAVEEGYRLQGKDAVYSPMDWCMKRLTDGDSTNLWLEYEAVIGGTSRARAASAS